MEGNDEYSGDFKKYAVGLVKEIFERDYAPAQSVGEFSPLESTWVPESNDQITDPELEYAKLNPIYAMQAAKKRRAGGQLSEILRYLAEPQAVGTDPLTWWKANAVQYPNLCLMACDYLAIPGSSAPCERIFSGAKNIVTDQRNRLLAETIRAVMCLKSWWTTVLKLKALNVQNNTK